MSLLGVKYQSAPGYGPIVLKGVGSLERSETGAVTQTLEYVGISTFIQQFALNLPLGNRAVVRNDGPISYLTVTLGLQANDAKWELQTESLEQDILNAPIFAPVANPLSQAARDAFVLWRTTPGANTPGAIIAAPSGGWPNANDSAFLAQLQVIWRRGQETVPANALILKLTGTYPALYIPQISAAPSIATTILSSDQIYRLWVVPANQLFPFILPGVGSNASAAMGGNPLPSIPNALPNGTDTSLTWGWRPRQTDLSYIGKGMVEVAYDWEFAAWSTPPYVLSTQ